MTTITEQFQLRVNSPSDINQHLETIKNYASECEHITEMGVRSVVSTWAFLASNPKRLVSMDIVQCPVQGAAIAAKNEGIDFEFIVADTSNPQLNIEPTDLLFIDTWHVYEQLKKEFAAYPMNDVDGLKIDFENEWAHLRSSNTEPILRIYTEAKTQAGADALADKIIQLIHKIQ